MEEVGVEKERREKKRKRDEVEEKRATRPASKNAIFKGMRQRGRSPHRRALSLRAEDALDILYHRDVDREGNSEHNELETGGGGWGKGSAS